MIVLVVEHIRLPISKLKRQAPIAINPDRPTASILSLQGVKPEPWNIHIFYLLSSFERHKQHTQPLGVPGLDAGLRSCLVETAQTLVPE
jgi:hypothetical protein